MTMNRRQSLLLFGSLLITTLAAGCLDTPSDDSSTTDPPDNNSPDENPTDDNSTGETETSDPTETPNKKNYDAGELPDGISRVDTPPYEIAESTCDFGEDGEEVSAQDPMYLCENMPEEPTLPLNYEVTTGRVFTDEGLTLNTEDQQSNEFYVELLTTEDDLERLEMRDGNSFVELLEEIDFESEAVLVAQTGWGSGSIRPHIKRIEETNYGIRVFACYSKPCIQTADYTMRTAVTRFDRPDSIDEAVFSLTVDRETRVNIAAGEGLIGFDEL